MLWLYEKTGDDRILKYAQEVYAEYNKVHSSDDTSVESMLSNRRSICHGVSYNEISKLGAVMYIYTGNKKLLDATINAYRKLDRDQMLIDGVCSSAEALLGKDPLDSHETCDIADYMWSNGYLLMATGSTEYADKIERACFNAAPGAVRSDFKGLQYFSCPNQVIADKTSNHNLYVKGHAWMSFRPNPGTPCCPGDVNRIMPNYAARMWMSSGNGNIAAVLYGPSRVNAKAGCEKKEITIVEDTSYPFSDRIDFQIRTDAPVEFNFSMRIPGWCKEAKVLLNGHKQDLAANSGSFIHLKRIFSNNDRITLILPMSLQLSHWPYEGIGIERGPLVYSLRICEDWRIDHEDNRSTEDFPAWNLYPASPWNYALAVSEKNLEEAVKIIHHQVSPEPWSIDTAPIELKVPARRVSGWKIERNKSDTALIDTREGKKYIKVRGNFTPQLPDPSGLGKRLRKRMETVSLVPYGCTKLRISIFPSADGID
jgi:DUF1680 family protein